MFTVYDVGRKNALLCRRKDRIKPEVTETMKRKAVYYSSLNMGIFLAVVKRKLARARGNF